MTATAALLSSLDTITAETVTMFSVLDDAESVLSPSDRREAKRRVLEIRTKAHELFNGIESGGLPE